MMLRRFIKSTKQLCKPSRMNIGHKYRHIGEVSIALQWHHVPFEGRYTYCTKSIEKNQHIENLMNHIDLMEILSCSGCGIEIQFKNPKEIGYCDSKALENISNVQEITTQLICQRCFQIRNYGKITDTKIPYDEYEKRVKALKPRDMLMVQLVDVLDITGSLLGNARHVVGKKPVLLVVNKGDLIPQFSGERRLMRRIKSAAEDLGVENIIGIRLVSSIKGTGIKEIISDIKKHRQNRDVCVIGAANAGKSTFLNALISHSNKKKKFPPKKKEIPEISDIDITEIIEQTEWNVEDPNINLPDEELINKKKLKEISNLKIQNMTTSSLPGTTLAVSPIPFHIGNDSCNILDTPGLIVNRKRQKLIEALSQPGCSELNQILPGKKLPINIFKLIPGRSLFLGAMIRLDYELNINSSAPLKQNSLLFSWYGVLPGHLSKTINAEETYLKHAGGLLSPPRGLDALSFSGPLLPRDVCHLKEYITKDIKTRSNNPKKPKRTSVVELVVPGFGWLSVTGVDMDGSQSLEQTLNHAKIQILACEGVDVHPRVPLFPFEMTLSNKKNWKD